ncbi:MAG: 2-oxoacid ferredoxin oxidoreductase, partial [Actinomycetia bacterium]|nr:2-oxoacid ferredoxin oxidoreductase [Actinomycetes bacterium]
GAALASTVERCVFELVDYQSLRYAREYAEFVELVRREESRRIPGSERLTEAVAHHLHKLMAYKDEYEVARLALAPEATEQVEAEFGPGVSVSHLLHPPVLRALGMRRKITLGSWFLPVFRVLRGMRRLRGSRLDLFGYAKVRRVERLLVEEYRAAILAVLPALDAATSSRAVELAELPDQVRGYEDIKLARVDAYRTELHTLTDEFAAADPGNSRNQMS